MKDLYVVTGDLARPKYYLVSDFVVLRIAYQKSGPGLSRGLHCTDEVKGLSLRFPPSRSLDAVYQLACASNYSGLGLESLHDNHCLVSSLVAML